MLPSESPVGAPGALATAPIALCLLAFLGAHAVVWLRQLRGAK